MLVRMLRAEIIDCDMEVTWSNESKLLGRFDRCAKCRMPPALFDSWGVPWCSGHWKNTGKKLNPSERTRTKKAGMT